MDNSIRERVKVRAYYLSLRNNGERRVRHLDNWLEAEDLEYRGKSLCSIPTEEDGINSRSSGVLATYDLNRFIIKLTSSINFLDENLQQIQEIDPIPLSVFLHEYFHFIHNISTISGWDNFWNYQSVLAIVSNSLSQEKYCETDRLTEILKSEASLLARYISELEGDTKISMPFRIRDIDVESLTEIDDEIGCRKIKTIKANWRLTLKDGSIEFLENNIGSGFLEEGIAYFIESSIREGKAAFCDSSDKYGIPIYPYKAFQKLCEYLVPGIEPMHALKLAILSLNTHMPGYYLVNMLKKFSELISNNKINDQELFFHNLRIQQVSHLNNVLINVKSDLKLFLQQYVGRGYLEDGARQLFHWFDSALSARRKNVWFDIEWIEKDGLNFGLLNHLLHSFFPCDTIHKNFSPEINREEIILTSPKMYQDKKSHFGVRGIHSQMHFLDAHLTKRGLINTSETVGSSKCQCPFYKSCDLPIRDAMEHVCRESPWKNIELNGECWYAAGVQALFADFVNTGL